MSFTHIGDVNEVELMNLLAGTRRDPIFVGRVSARVAAAINAHTTAVWLSRDTVEKQESKHRADAQETYRMVPIVLASRFIRIESPCHAIFIHHYKDGADTKSYKAVVKTTADGSEIYLVSIHRAGKGDVRAVYRKTVSLTSHERSRREVGPPKNPT